MVSFSSDDNLGALRERLAELAPHLAEFEVEELVLYGDTAKRLHEAGIEYRAAYESWQQLYNQYLGHGVPEEKRKTKEHRLAGAAAVRQGLEHEKVALAEVERALSALE